MLQIIDALSHDKLTLKEQLEKANERIKALEQENQSKFSFRMDQLIIHHFLGFDWNFYMYII